MLPPTLGRHFPARSRRWPGDDLASKLTLVSYYIIVSILNPSKGCACNEARATHTREISIIPKFREDPPTYVFGRRWRCTRKTKGVREWFFSGQSGTLTVTACQPNPIQVLGAATGEYDCLSTAATVKLRFVSKGNVSPPELQTIRSELQADTFYSITPWSNYPTWAFEDGFSYSGGCVFSKILRLSKMSISSVHWDVTSQDTNGQFNSQQSEPDCAEFSDQWNTLTGDGYIASVLIPVIPPKSKRLVPTFHSCFISRTYQLNLTLSYRQSIGSHFTSKLSLRVPIQVTA